MKSLKRFVEKVFYDKKTRQMKKYKREITCHMKHLKTKRKLTSEQKEEIQSFYKSVIGQEIDLYSHEYFYSRTGVFSKEYIPTNLHAVELLGKANDFQRATALGDKNMTDILLKGVKMPHTILKRINGYYYYEGRPVSEEEAISLCQNMFKVGRSGKCVDNAGNGGNVDGCVDKETGELKYVIQFDGWNKVKDIEKHPDSGCQLEGVKIENWKSIVEEVLHFQECFPYVKAAGWDIAITNEGPVVIEVNDFWDRTGQYFIRRGWRNEIRDCYLAWKATEAKYPMERQPNKLSLKHLTKIAKK